MAVTICDMYAHSKIDMFNTRWRGEDEKCVGDALKGEGL